MNNNSNIIDAAIAHFASSMGNCHGPGFTAACRRAVQQAGNLATLNQEEIIAQVQAWADEYQAAAKIERDRILGIDMVAAQLPPGFEAMVKRAKFETPVSVNEFAEQVLATHRKALQPHDNQQSGSIPGGDRH